MKLNISKAMGEAREAMRVGNADRAEAILRQIVEIAPKEANAHFGLGTIAANSQRPEEAIERFKVGVSLEPRNLQGHFSLGVLLTYEKRYQEALPHLEITLAAQPKNLDAMICSGHCLYHLKQPSRALSYYNRALKLKPGDPDLLFSRVTCLQELDRAGAAEADLRQALDKAPNSRGYAVLAEIELMFGRPLEAIRDAETSIQMDSENPVPYVVMAKALTALDRIPESEGYWEKASAWVPDRAELFYEKAKTLISFGLFEKAKVELQEAISLRPRSGKFYSQLVFSGKVTEEDRPLIDRLESLLEDPELERGDRLQVLYSIGKAYDDLSSHGIAIGFFDLANELKKSLRPVDEIFDREQLRSSVDLQISRFTRAFFDQHQDAGNPSEVPIFVLGMMRSGTTLMEQLLSAHKEIGGGGEQPFWPEHEAEIKGSDGGKFEFKRLPRLTEEYLEILRGTAPGSERIVDKNPANCLLVDLISLAFPNSKIIHMRRNPVDTALSIWMTPMTTNAPFTCDRSDIVYAYRQYWRLAEHYKAILPRDRYLEVRYEDLTEDPERAMREVLEFLNLEWDPNCLRPEENKRTVRTPSVWQVRQPLYKTSTQRWKNYEPWLGEFERLATLSS